jgi:SAM-dependent methyltransferase
MMFLLQMVLDLILLGISLGGVPAGHAEEGPYVQTPANVVEAMLAMAEVGPKDYVVDLGSGDGRIVIAAAKRYQARGLGIDYDETLITESRAKAAREGVLNKVEFRNEDIFLADFREATVLTMYLLPEVNLELRPRILSGLRAGTRVVSHDWDMADWEPDRHLVIEAPEKTVGLKKESTIYLWILPARIAGYWHGTLAGPGGEEPVVVEFAQRFQKAQATVWLPRWTLAGSGRLSGENLTLSLERSPWMVDSETLRFTLRVADGHIRGEAVDSSGRHYLLHATRLVE